ncbi:MAG: hypothetical protein ACK4HL_19285, partial [Aestuariivirga sp.]
MRLLTRRSFVGSGLAFGVFSGTALAGESQPLPRVIRPGDNPSHVRKVPVSLYEMDLGPDPDLLPPPEAEFDYPIVPAADEIPSEFRAQTVEFPAPALAGMIVVVPAKHFLYLINGDG